MRVDACAEILFDLLPFLLSRGGISFGTVTADFAKIALELPPEECLELAPRRVESVVEHASMEQAVAEGIRRIEDIITGRIKPLTEEEYHAALK